MWVAFALHIFVSLNVNFNESLTNDVVSFEQLGPERMNLQGDLNILWAHMSKGIFSHVMAQIKNK